LNGTYIARYNEIGIQRRSRPSGPTTYPSSFGAREAVVQLEESESRREKAGKRVQVRLGENILLVL
jgi:hypothetical protein